MDAALDARDAAVVRDLRQLFRLDDVLAARSNDVVFVQAEAFLRDNRIPGQLVENRNDTTAELSDGGEGVFFTADVVAKQVDPEMRGELRRREVPFANNACGGQLADEFLECRVAVLQAGAGTNSEVERGRIAAVVCDDRAGVFLPILASCSKDCTIKFYDIKANAKRAYRFLQVSKSLHVLNDYNSLL